MKKTFTLIAAVLPLLASAQIEQLNIDTEALGLSGEAIELAEGTVLGSTESVTMKLAYADGVKASDIKFNDMSGLWFGKDFFSKAGGITGSTNPQNCKLTGAANGGFVLQLDVQKDGYVICMSKLSSNKNYYVFEGLSGEGELPLAYNVGLIWDAGDGTKAHVIDMPADADGYLNLEAADIDKYCTDAATRQLRYILTGDLETNLTGNGFGFIGFPVYAEAEHYLVYAQGSKMSLNGYVFIPTTTDNPADAKPNSVFAGTEEGAVYEFVLGGPNSNGEPAGISAISLDNGLNPNAPIYNVMGQRVNANAKGLLIQNGRKFYNK